MNYKKVIRNGIWLSLETFPFPNEILKSSLGLNKVNLSEVAGRNRDVWFLHVNHQWFRISNQHGYDPFYVHHGYDVDVYHTADLGIFHGEYIGFEFTLDAAVRMCKAYEPGKQDKMSLKDLAREDVNSMWALHASKFVSDDEYLKCVDTSDYPWLGNNWFELFRNGIIDQKQLKTKVLEYVRNRSLPTNGRISALMQLLSKDMISREECEQILLE